VPGSHRLPSQARMSQPTPVYLSIIFYPIPAALVNTIISVSVAFDMIERTDHPDIDPAFLCEKSMAGERGQEKSALDREHNGLGGGPKRVNLDWSHNPSVRRQGLTLLLIEEFAPAPYAFGRGRGKG